MVDETKRQRTLTRLKNDLIREFLDEEIYAKVFVARGILLGMEESLLQTIIFFKKKRDSSLETLSFYTSSPFETYSPVKVNSQGDLNE